MWIEHRLSKNHILNTWISKDTLFSDFSCNVPPANHAYECATDIYWITKEYHKHGKVSLLTSQPAENPEVKVDFRLTKHQFTNRSPKTSTLNGLEGKSIDFYIKYGGFPVMFPLNPLNQSIETPMKNRTPLPRIGKWRIIPLEAQPWLGGGHNRILCDSPWVIHEYLPGWYTYPSEKYESVGIIIPSIWEKCSKPPISLSTSLSTSCNLVIVFLVDTVWALALWISCAPDALRSLIFIVRLGGGALDQGNDGRATLESGASNGWTQGTHERFIYADISIFNLIIYIYIYYLAVQPADLLMYI